MRLPLPLSHSHRTSRACSRTYIPILVRQHILTYSSATTHRNIILHVIEMTGYLLYHLILLGHLALEHVPLLLHVGVHHCRIMTSIIISNFTYLSICESAFLKFLSDSAYEPKIACSLHENP